jgi:hypothetical protein
MDSIQCQICCDNFNSSTRATVTCPNADCNFECCKTCVRTYLLGSIKDPHCMHCNHGWDQQFLVENLNKNFMIKDYKEHRQKILLERELSKMPETVDAASRHKKSEINIKKSDEIKQQIRDLKRHIHELKVEEIRYRKRADRILRGADNKGERRAFIMACPSEDCRGFLSTQYKCELCKLKTCSKCFEIMGHEGGAEEHTCLEENIQSATLIRKETKPCPSCGTRISKINGCDQMWCVNCHQAFSWNTGEIDNSAVHNPHFYQYEKAANNGEAIRQVGDILCGGLIGWRNFRARVFPYLSTLEVNCSNGAVRTIIFDIQKKLTSLHSFITYISHYLLDTVRRNVRELGNTEKTRISYILNDITKEELSSTIYKIDVNRRKLTEILNIYELINVVGIEMFTTITNIDREIHRPYLKTILIEINKFENFLEYCNDQFSYISITYNCSVSQITNSGLVFNKKFNKHEISDLQKARLIKERCEKLYMEKYKKPMFLQIEDNYNDVDAAEADGCSYTIAKLRGFNDNLTPPRRPGDVRLVG